MTFFIAASRYFQIPSDKPFANILCSMSPLDVLTTCLYMDIARFKLSFQFQSKEWLQLKVLEMQPELTRLGVTADEANDFLKTHEHVLRQLEVITNLFSYFVPFILCANTETPTLMLQHPAAKYLFQDPSSNSSYSSIGRSHIHWTAPRNPK